VLKLREILERLMPKAERRDPRFRDYLRSQGRPGLRMLAIVEMAIPVFMLGGRAALMPGTAIDPGRWWQAGAAVGVGLATLALSGLPWSGRHPRLLAAISAFVAPAALMWMALLKPSGYLGTDDYVLTGISLVLLTAVATMPLLPWHTLALGLGIEGMYILSCWVAVRWEIPSSYVDSDAHHIFLVMLTLLGTGIAATNYSHRQREYEATQEAIRVAESLTGAQLRAQLAENAISIGKMAAALSHEINSPLGALRSSVETLVSVAEREATATAQRREVLRVMREELRRSIEESAARIDDVTRRLRRFVNLEEAELKSADVNELLSDVTLLHQQDLEAKHIALNFELEKPLPALTCRPQLLSAVFSNLLSNAIQAVNGDGRVGIATRLHEGSIEVTVMDNGKGMSAEEAETIFDPAFKVDGSRVASGNWSLFNTRQIVYEHGGEIHVETAQGKGTAVHVMLPV